MLKGIIFDMDGTLGDTLQLCIKAYQGSVQELTGRTSFTAFTEQGKWH